MGNEVRVGEVRDMKRGEVGELKVNKGERSRGPNVGESRVGEVG